MIILCLNLPFKVKNQLTFYKVRWFKQFLLFSIIDVLRISEALQIFFYNFLLKWGENEEDFESSIFFEAQKYYVTFESRLIIFLFKWSYSQDHFDVAQRCANGPQQTQRRRYNVVAMSLSNVALMPPYSCDGNVGRHCKNGVVATSHEETS